MTHTKTLRSIVAALTLVVAWVATATAAQAEIEPGWRLRFSFATMDFDSGLRVGPGYDIDIGAAVAVNAEYRFSRRLGLDLGAVAGGGVDVVGYQSRIGAADWTVYDTMSVTGLTAGLDIHLTPESRVDLYVCPMVAMIQYGGLVFHTGPRQVATGVDFDEDLAFGAGLGLDVPFGERRSWSFNANLARLESSLNGRDSGDLRIEEDYDVTMFGVGFGYRF